MGLLFFDRSRGRLGLGRDLLALLRAFLVLGLLGRLLGLLLLSNAGLGVAPRQAVDELLLLGNDLLEGPLLKEATGREGEGAVSGDAFELTPRNR